MRADEDEFALVGLALLLVALCLQAAAFATLWGWFVLPKFPELPSFSWAEALGLSFTLAAFRAPNRERPDPAREKSMLRYGGEAVILTALIFMLGALAHAIAH